MKIKKFLVISIIFIITFSAVIYETTDGLEAQNKYIIHDVPFSSQAPKGNWSDLRQQDGCEETSSLMAVMWARKEKFKNAGDNEKKLLAISDWEKKNYKTFKDTSIKDTAERILIRYFNFKNFSIKENITKNDIVNELYKGNIVMLPINGIKLKNPNYKQPGPPRHMILVIGYDPVKKLFITNDPGTRKGEKYKYPEKVLYEAIRDYPSGDNLPIRSIKKNMVIIKPLKK